MRTPKHCAKYDSTRNFHNQITIIMISNSNWTEWSTIQGVIGRVISNRPSAKREADLKLRARLLPELYDKKSNY